MRNGKAEIRSRTAGRERRTGCFRPAEEEKQGRKRQKKSRFFNEKTVDLGCGMWYIFSYLSDERFLFARIFCRLLVLYREAMPAAGG